MTKYFLTNGHTCGSTNSLTVGFLSVPLILIFHTYFLARQAITPIRTYLKKLARHTGSKDRHT